ncbi:hypothetical protein J3Q64DRAFT_1634936 [Phycomyces blakesleeanus]
MRILKKYIKVKALEANFEIWRKSDFADDYWTKRLRSSTARKSGRKAAEHVHKAIINEYAQLDEHLEGESALSDTTTDGSDYIESEQHFVYWLTFDELNDKSLKRSSSKYVLNKKQSTFNQRLGLSSITLIPAEEMFTLKRHSLNDDCYLMVRQFKRAVEESKLSIPADWSQSSDSLRPLLYCVLTYTLNIINIDRKHEHTKQDIVRKSEPNFISKYVANFFQNIMFAYQDSLFFRWDTCSEVYDESKKKKRPDFIICTFDGFEVGCGEIKQPGTNYNDVEEDRCRVPEQLKKQLHKRLQTASEEKELATFGCFVFGEELELSMMEFKQGRYEYSVIKKLKLPTMCSTFERMDQSLEFLLGFFDIIKNTIVGKDGPVDSSLFLKYKQLLKPTISFE